MKCKDCEAYSLNGFYCHETECPSATYTINCKWCGSEFKQEKHGQLFCDESCQQSYNRGD